MKNNDMSAIIARIKAEPALAVGVVVAILSLVAAFGVPISDQAHAAVVGVVSAVLALLGAGVTRSKVTPVKQPPASDGTPSATGLPEQPARMPVEEPNLTKPKIDPPA